jgi:hypothetical protein
MKTRVNSFLLRTSSAIAIALLTLSFAVGGSHAVRADDPESFSLPVQEAVLIPVKDVQALEQRLIYLEEKVATLTEARQHVNTHQLCVSDDDGAETCITKAQLDALLIGQARATEASPPAAIVGEANTLLLAETVTIATTTDNSEPAPNAVPSDVSKDQEPEQTGALTPIALATELDMIPDSQDVDF